MLHSRRWKTRGKALPHATQHLGFPPVKVLVTGGSGFIGGHTCEGLLNQCHQVRVLDNFATGRRLNTEHLLGRLELVEGDISDLNQIRNACSDIDTVLHLAAIPSVPRSVQDPVTSNGANIDGTLNVLVAARDAGIRRVVLASSSSVYGAATEFPLRETLPRIPLSPYAVTKAAGEMYGEAFTRVYGMEVVSLRYFNVFGPRQNPNAQYAAVIPAFINRMLKGQRPIIYGDGTQQRDFTYIANVAHANICALTAPSPITGIFNIACGGSVSLLDLMTELNNILDTNIEPDFQSARTGDLPRSFADITRAQKKLNYSPGVSWRDGLTRTVDYYRSGEEGS